MLKTTVLCKPIANSRAPQLFIERGDFEEMIRYAQAAGIYEVCGYAFARQVDASTFAVIRGTVFIVDQHVGTAAAMTDPSGEVEAMDKEEVFDEDGKIVRILWHSHVGGSATFSTTDLKAHGDIGKATAIDAMFFVVVNTGGQATANFEVYQPYRIGGQAGLLVIEKVEEVDLRPYKATIAAKCRVIPPPKPKTHIFASPSTTGRGGQLTN